VSTFRGMYLDSDSLTGGRSQRFKKQELLELLNDKVEELMDSVSGTVYLYIYMYMKKNNRELLG
jgi:hypothetical protein